MSKGVKTMYIGMSKKHIDFLDKLIREIRFSSGKKFSRTTIIKALFGAIKKRKINVKGVKSEAELKKRVISSWNI